MNRCLIVLSLLVASALASWAEGARGDTGSLSLSVIASKDESGNPMIDYNGKFWVLFTNRSNEPIRLWSERCQLGYSTLSFRVEDGGGPPAIMRKRIPDASAWKNKPPKTITVPTGGTYRWTVAPAAFFWGDREWIAPEPNTGTPFKLTAVFEVEPTALAKERGVWTGRVTSEPLKVLVTDAKLRTPQEYLWAGFPKQALKIVQADRQWIDRQDDMQRTPLHLAARFGYIEVVRWLLSNGADVNARCYNRFTPLHMAKEPEVVRMLLAHKADVEARGASGTALQQAAGDYAHLGRYSKYASERDKARAITKILLGAGAEYDMLSACYLGDLDRVRVLAADKPQARSVQAMRMAATYGRAEIVKLLLGRGADPEEANYGGLTVSYFAIEHPDVLTLLFDAGADPKVRVTYRGNGNGPEGSTLLHEAAGKGLIETAKLLVARGVAVDVRDSRGATPLDEACRGGHPAMVDWLLRNKANVNAHADKGRTPMSLAAAEVRPEQDEENAKYQAVVRSLEHSGVELDVMAAIARNDIPRVASILQTDPKAGQQRTRGGMPALHQAVMLDRRNIVELLLEKGCDPDVRSQDRSSGYPGETALFEAAFWGRPETAEMLIKHGANVNASARRGVVPLHEAARMGSVEMVRLLLQHGAKVNSKDEGGQTPLDWSNWSNDGEGSPEIAELLRKHGA